MSPAAALASDLVRFYVVLVVALVGGAGALIATLQWALHRNVRHAWNAWRGWVAMVPIIATCLFLGRWTTIALVATIGVAAYLELARATGLDRALTICGCSGVAALGAIALVAPTFGISVQPGAVPIAIAAVLIAVPVVRDRADGQLRLVAIALLGFVVVGWMFGFVAWLANSPSAYSDLLFLLVAVELTDVAAFTSGRLFGRHALRPHISPGKTWEGAAGGLAVALALPWLLRFALPDFSALQCVLAGLAVGVGGPIGDLVISVVKREAGVKDFGTLIPGHGGVLDRIDSLAYAAPLFYGVTRLAHG